MVSGDEDVGARSVGNGVVIGIDEETDVVNGLSIGVIELLEDFEYEIGGFF